jgi:hypothetical protein
MEDGMGLAVSMRGRDQKWVQHFSRRPEGLSVSVYEGNIVT